MSCSSASSTTIRTPTASKPRSSTGSVAAACRSRCRSRCSSGTRRPVVDSYLAGAHRRGGVPQDVAALAALRDGLPPARRDGQGAGLARHRVERPETACVERRQDGFELRSTGLPPTERAWVAVDLQCPHDVYFDRFADAMNGHQGVGTDEARARSRPAPPSPPTRQTAEQRSDDRAVLFLAVREGRDDGRSDRCRVRAATAASSSCTSTGHSTATSASAPPSASAGAWAAGASQSCRCCRSRISTPRARRRRPQARRLPRLHRRGRNQEVACPYFSRSGMSATT